MTTINFPPCQHCAAKLARIDRDQDALTLAKAAARILVQCRKCLAHVPRSLRPKRWVLRMRLGILCDEFERRAAVGSVSQ